MYTYIFLFNLSYINIRNILIYYLYIIFFLFPVCLNFELHVVIGRNARKYLK